MTTAATTTATEEPELRYEWWHDQWEPIDEYTAAVLARTTEILKNGGWCQRHTAVDAAGAPVSELDDAAAAWCYTGAVAKAMSEEPEIGGLHAPRWKRIFNQACAVFQHAVKDVEPEGANVHPVVYNDDTLRTKDEVVRAAELTAAEGRRWHRAARG